MTVMGTNEPIIEAPLNHNTSRNNNVHVVAAILEEVAFNPLSHDATMTSDQTSGRVHKAEIYSVQYMEAMLGLTMDRQI